MEDRNQITLWGNINDYNPWFDSKGGDNTTDKVFLLSLDEVIKCFCDSGQLRDNPPAQKMWLSDPSYNKDRRASVKIKNIFLQLTLHEQKSKRASLPPRTELNARKHCS